MKPGARSVLIFDFEDYRSYLSQKLGGAGQRTGMYAKAARAIRCHPTYFSQVMREKADLSGEQAEDLNQFFTHTEEEAEFFHWLVEMARAATPGYRRRIKAKIEAIRLRRAQVQFRVGQKDEVSNEQREIFYSTYLYGAIHVLVSIEKFKTIESLAEGLRVPRGLVAKAVEFLIECGILRRNQGALESGNVHIHLKGNSPSIKQHHTNWRLHAAQSLVHATETDLHYSACVTLSEKDVQKVREILLSAIKKSVEVIEPSKSERAFVLSADFYPLLVD